MISGVYALELLRCPPARDAGESLLPGRWPRVLVVDDDPELCSLMASSLRALGPRQCLLTETDPERACALLRAFQPHLLVADLEMPGFNGLGLNLLAGRGPFASRIPTIVVSEQTGVIARTRAFLAGASEYLAKPFTPEELREAAMRVLEQNAPVARP